MKSIEFEAWAIALKLPAAGRTAIDRIRSTPPARRVRSSRGNVSGTFCSKKMGTTIQFESHTLELPLIHLLEHDDDILEYYDQPEPIPFSYKMADGRKIGFNSVPDFFVLRRAGAGWIEVKPAAQLEKLCLKSPDRVSKDGSGRWICPPGTRYAKPLGLNYELATEEDINPILAANLDFLAPYRVGEINPKRALEVECILGDQPGISFDALIETTGIEREGLFRLIAMQRIHVDLQIHRLSRSKEIPVFLSKQQVGTKKGGRPPLPQILPVRLNPGTELSWNGAKHRILNSTGGLVSIESLDGTIQELREEAFSKLVTKGRIKAVPADPATVPARSASILATLGVEEMRRIVERQRLLSESPEAISRSTRRRWRKAMRHADTVHGSEVLGLVGNHRKRGNRTRKLAEPLIREMDQFIAENFENLKGISASTAYHRFVLHCTENGLRPPSDPTFRAAIKARSGHRQRKSREGHRGAYAEREFFYLLLPHTPRHGDHSFHIGHIDHTELDVELVDEETGQPLGRPWLSLLIDAFSRRILAFALTFDPPSYRSCMLLVRDCVRRHGRFPRVIVVDGGKEFQGVYFETLLAFLGCTKKVRPPAQARFGSVLERLFGTATKQFIHNLRGNTKLTRRSRAVTKATDPKRLAVWTLDDLNARLEEYFLEVYDILSHSTLLRSPRETFLTGMRDAAACGPLIPYDEPFRILTLPEAPRGTCQIHRTKGIQVLYIRYWNDLFRVAGVQGTAVPVRYDPFDLSKVYVFLKGMWTACRAWSGFIPQGTTEREIRLTTLAYRRRLGSHAQHRRIDETRLGEFLRDADDQEIFLQRRRDRALARVLADAENTVLTLSPDFEAPTTESALPGRSKSHPESIAPKPPHRAIEPFEEL